ncbi:Glycerophosphoryl diester phosphodiesterase periplasmic (secreted in GramPositives) [Cupriavidus necator H850]|uniref:glycerophosphodiester phosphodiesterase n=1 Tax=Cupriavidus TaxID=106589 RepID=UPI00129EF8A6|nr:MULTISPECIES: glycerophosphodiester phosphodiesterase [Cupriavidus]KAI3599911.1 Glycerophosphoryl diester phosphodiesterase periplasmic (secreted in GramPositives) [Cupriavidus necator H850]QUN28928.1 glycerophosphodiester phosphodiesterase [Cupriavidus sp. KK10]
MPSQSRLSAPRWRAASLFPVLAFRRWLFPAAAACAVLVAGCATAPRPKPVSAAPVPAPAASAPPAAAATQPPRPLVIAHRGASALRPEHTLAAYAKAIEDGADAIEPDLVMTRDGVLVARHENDITGTTNVAELPQFAERKRTKVIDGERLSGWFTEDFTLAELKTLRARERIPRLRPANARLNDQFEVPTFDEIVRLAEQASLRTGKPIGIYPELKHPSYFRGIGLPLEDKLAAALRAQPYLRQAPVFIQCFESGSLRAMRRTLGRGLPNVKLVQLIGNPRKGPADWKLAGDPRTFDDMLSTTGLREVAAYADGIGPEKSSVVPRDAQGALAAPTPVVRQAHAAGLFVHPYTFRPENSFLPKALQTGGDDATRSPSGMEREVQAFIAAGIDGFFTDDPALGRRAVDTPAR